MDPNTIITTNKADVSDPQLLQTISPTDMDKKGLNMTTIIIAKTIAMNPRKIMIFKGSSGIKPQI